jgi:dihydrodipicolinate reductase
MIEKLVFILDSLQTLSPKTFTALVEKSNKNDKTDVKVVVDFSNLEDASKLFEVPLTTKRNVVSFL